MGSSDDEELNKKALAQAKRDLERAERELRMYPEDPEAKQARDRFKQIYDSLNE